MLPVAREGLDVTGAAIVKQSVDEGPQKRRDAPSISLPKQDASCVSHIAVDIGGSLIKLVYFQPDDDAYGSSSTTSRAGGKLHFVKFETAKVNQAIDFIEARGLHRRRSVSSISGDSGNSRNSNSCVNLDDNGGRIKATGGGAFKFAELFEERLGVVLEKEDEMECLVAGCNFLLKAIYHEAFAYEMGDGPTYVTPHSESDVFPYLLVNIGSGVSMLKVAGDGDHERVSGSSLGGGTFWGLCRLLTKVRAFDEMLELSAQGDNAKVDMLVGDIYGDRDYSSIGLSATTIASSFGKVISEDKDLEDYQAADIAMALCRMVSYNIGQLAYLNAKRYGLSRIIFGGFFIRGHSYTMDTISFSINFWSKGEMKANFLRHEGYLGAVGAFLSVNPMESAHPQPTEAASPNDAAASMEGSRDVSSKADDPLQVRTHFVENFAATHLDDTDVSPAAGKAISTFRSSTDPGQVQPSSPPHQSSDSDSENYYMTLRSASVNQLRLHVGALHYMPGAKPFPLLKNRSTYQPDTFDMMAPCTAEGTGGRELDYWLSVLAEQIPTVAERAAASLGNTAVAEQRASTFIRSFGAHITRLQEAPNAYGELGLSELFELREECLRESGFEDIYKSEKQRETAAALVALRRTVTDLDNLPPTERLAAIIKGALAANVYDLGSRAVTERFKDETACTIYGRAQREMCNRPWRVDDLATLGRKWFSNAGQGGRQEGGGPWKKAILFLDNAGADVVLGMLPLARELLKMGTEVVLAANSSPAVNDITAYELRRLLNSAATHEHVLGTAWEEGLRALGRESESAAQHADAPHSIEPDGHPASPTRPVCLTVVETGQGGPCLDLRRVTSSLAAAARTADLVVLEGMGRAVLTNYKAEFKCDVLRLAMLKNDHVASTLFGGKAFDCICNFCPSSP